MNCRCGLDFKKKPKQKKPYAFSSEASYSKVKSCFRALAAEDLKDLAQPCWSDDVISCGYDLK